jgi:hypothetical protein
MSETATAIPCLFLDRRLYWSCARNTDTSALPRRSAR